MPKLVGIPVEINSGPSVSLYCAIICFFFKNPEWYFPISALVGRYLSKMCDSYSKKEDPIASLRFFVLNIRAACWAFYYCVKAWNRIGASVILFIAACAAPQYDDQTDKLISQLQTDVNTEIVSLITLDHKISNLAGKTDAASQKALAAAKSKAEYDANTTFYDKVDVDLTSLQTRVDAEPSAATPHLDKAIQDLRDNLLAGNGSMQALHQKLGILPET